MDIPILLLAAGSGTRMRGGDKLLEPVRGRPLLRDRAEAALAASPTVIVALPPAAPRADALAGLPVTRIVVADAATGMSASLRAALAAVTPDAEGALILPADMPEITADDLRAVIAAFAADPARPITCGASGGRLGHPVLFPARLFPALARVTGDRGGRALIEAHGASAVPLPAEHALTDLDTPEAWAAWRAANPGA